MSTLMNQSSMVKNEQLFTLLIQKASGSGTPYTTDVYVFFSYEKEEINKRLAQLYDESNEFYERRTHPGAWMHITMRNVLATKKDLYDKIDWYVDSYCYDAIAH